LPPELRIRVYRFVFKFDDPIEFWPETTTTGGDFYYRNKNRNHMRYLLKNRKLNLDFLRTCRTVHAEGSEVFYGENDFRFSAINGHMTANLFVRKIYKQHFQYLTALMIPMPFQSADKSTYNSNNNPFSNRTYALWSGAVPFSSWQDKLFKYEEALDHLLGNLLRAVRFVKLVLVLREWYRPDAFHICNPDCLEYHCESGRDIEDCSMWKALTAFIAEKSKHERGCKSGITIEIVRLCNEDEVLSDPWKTETESWQAHSGNMHYSHEFLIREFKKLASDEVKVEIQGAYISDSGAWAVIEDLPEDALLPVCKEVEEDEDEDEDEDKIGIKEDGETDDEEAVDADSVEGEEDSTSI
jgi:hypothetical protein